MTRDTVQTRIADSLALIIGLFHLINVSGLVSFSTMSVRIFHLMTLMAIAFLIKPMRKGIADSGLTAGVSIVGAILSIAVGTYFLLRWKVVAMSGGVTRELDIIIGFVLILLVFETTRRTVGKTLVIIAIVFLLYPFIAPYMPRLIRARSFSVQRVFSFIISSQGLFGIPLGVSASYIILFTTYGAFLTTFGAGDFFFKLSRSLTRNLVAASAKSAVVFSTLIGMISGSAAGNVAVTGSFTIPLMKKEGYKNHEAGAIEAVVSTGGQIMPPIMGAAAFIMAEIIGTPYRNIMKAGIIPAMLFFTSIMVVVHLQALKHGLGKSSDSPAENEESEKLGKILLDGIPSMVPFLTLIVFMVRGASPFRAAFYSIIVLIGINLIWNIRRFTVSDFGGKIVRSIINGAKSAVPIAVACATAGIISGILGATGLGSKLSNVIVMLSNGHIFLALILTMVVSIILGMGLPTTAAYLILATVVAPALANMGVPLLTAHMFVFFFGCISTITPPVALASYVAAGISDAPINKVSWTAFRYGLTSYFLPFLFFYNAALLMDGTVFRIIISLLLCFPAVFSLGLGVIGHYKIKLSIVLRVFAFLAGLAILNQNWILSLSGLIVFTAVILLNIWQAKQQLRAPEEAS